VQSFFAALKVLSWKEFHHGSYATSEKVNGPETSICQEKMHAPVQLCCKHIFCEDCVSEWFERERTCPLCMALIKSADLRAFRDGSKFVCPVVLNMKLFYSVHFGLIQSILELFHPLWSYSVHYIYFGPNLSIRYYSVHFGPIWSPLIYSVHIGPLYNTMMQIRLGVARKHAVVSTEPLSMMQKADENSYIYE
ncbi:hypothetical protein SO802_017343, partial [Lithocarpus litseifolius]